MSDYDLQNGVCVGSGGGVNVIAIALGVAGGVVVLIILGKRLII